MQRHVAFVKVQLSRVRLRTELEKEKYRSWQGAVRWRWADPLSILKNQRQLIVRFMEEQ